MEKGITLTRSGGLFSFIVPQTWTSLESFTKIREYILQNSTVCKLTQLPKKVFENATVETCIFLVKKGGSKKESDVEIENLDEYGACAILRQFPQKKIQEAHLSNFQLHGHEESNNVIEKIRTNSTPLGEMVRFLYGFKTADDDKFIELEKMHQESKPFVRSAAIRRYWNTPPSEYVWYVPEVMVQNRKTARPGEKARFESEKIIVARMGKALMELMILVGCL